MDFTETTNKRVLSRVARELALIKDVAEPVLILNSSCLSEVPDMVLCDEHCTQHLCELCLKNNRIQSLPKDISKLRTLRRLYLPTNTLEHLPDALAELLCLTLLDVSNNAISSISPSVANMKSLEDLNIGNNKLAHLPDELWKMPCLRCLNAQGNLLEDISGEIVYCQSLSKLMLDCNELSSLPPQVTKLHNLKYLSLAGNTLHSLPNDFSATLLQTLLVDMNPGLSCIPVSLAPLSWWGTLGTEGCPVHVKEEDLSFLKPLRTCGLVPSLTELTARFLHAVLRIALRGNVTLWLPDRLCSILQLPLGLKSWLMPSGRCSQGFECQKVYFRHHYAMLVSGIFYKKLNARGVCKPNDLALSVNCCSSQCAKSYFSVY